MAIQMPSTQIRLQAHHDISLELGVASNRLEPRKKEEGSVQNIAVSHASFWGTPYLPDEMVIQEMNRIQLQAKLSEG